MSERESGTEEQTAGAEHNPAEAEELDLEVTLLTTLAARDVGGGEEAATETVDLGMLTETEKRALLRLLRDRLGIADGEPVPFPGIDTPAEGGSES